MIGGFFSVPRNSPRGTTQQKSVHSNTQLRYGEFFIILLWNPFCLFCTLFWTENSISTLVTLRKTLSLLLPAGYSYPISNVLKSLKIDFFATFWWFLQHFLLIPLWFRDFFLSRQYCTLLLTDTSRYYKSFSLVVLLLSTSRRWLLRFSFPLMFPYH